MGRTEELNDRDLFAEFVENGKPEHLFRSIMLRFKKKVYWQIRRLVLEHDDADELTQIVFIKLWKSAEEFKFNSAVSSYIFRIAYNESISFLKRKSKFTSFDALLDQDGHYSGMVDSNAIMDADEIVQKFQNALVTLPEKQRIVFQYRYYDDMSYKEISEITGTSEGALKASYHFAADKIKNFLETN